jgi:glycerate dehydrogenase
VKIVFLDRDTLPSHTHLRKPAFDHELVSYDRTSAAEAAARIADADIVLVNKVRLDASALSAAPRLKLIAVAATGTDNVDLDTCRARGIAVCSIFALRRSLCAYRDAVRAGRWQASGQFCFFGHPIRDLAGSTLGVIGDGVLGQAVAGIGRALGMNVQMSAFKGRTNMGGLYTPFERVLAESDVITLHCPLLPQTRHMIGATEFASMRRTPLLINTARGGLVDESAVGPALDAGQISGAAFDVVTQEPPGPGHPFLTLLDRPDFILTPHVAWGSEQATQTLADQLIDNVEAFARGKPTQLVSA